jgi:hypothetical protein
MRALAAGGRRAEALHHYRKLVRFRASELAWPLIARSSLTTLPTALAPIGLMTVPAAIRRVVPLIDRPA